MGSSDTATVGRRLDLARHPVYIYDEGTGTPIVLGHSLALNADVWAYQARALANQFRVIRLDFRGHGRTAGGESPFTLWDLADDVADILDALQVSRAVYAGISMGGMVGVRLALAHPERIAALGLFNTSAEEEDSQQKPLYDQVNESTRDQDANESTVNFLMQLMFSPSYLASHPEAARRIHDMLSKPNDAGQYHAARAVIWRDDVRDRLSEIRVPVHVVTSDRDASVPSEHSRHIHSAIAGSTLTVLDGSGHMTSMERPEAVTTILENLLETSS